MVSLRNQWLFFALVLQALMFSFFFYFRNVLFFGILRTWSEELVQNQEFQIGWYYRSVLQTKFDVNSIWNRFDEIVKKWRWDADSLINSLWVVSIKPDWSQLLQFITGKPDVGGHAQGKADLTSELSLIYLLCGNCRNPALACDGYVSITAFRVV